MSLLGNPKHEAFAQSIARGVTSAESYRAVYPDASSEAAETAGPRLLRTAKVTERVGELRAAATEVVNARVSFEIADAIEYCILALRTPAGEIDEHHQLCQEYSIDEINTGQGRGKLRKGNAEEGNESRGESIIRSRYKMPNKEGMLDKLIKLRGWYAPEKREVKASLSVSPEVGKALDALGITASIAD